MKVYIDENYFCHAENKNGELREIETDFFNGRCRTFIEGHQCIPDGESWQNSDGVILNGIAPWKPYSGLSAAQTQYELDMAEAAAAYQEGVNSAYDQ